jgi:large-conductance mechanosensitive channel
MIVKMINMARRKEAAVPLPPTKTEILLTEIRDLLKTR